MSTNDPNAQPFVKGDIVRTEDPDFEIVYAKPNASPPTPGTCTVLDASNEAIVANVGPHLKKISVMTSFVDRETSNIGLLQRGYIVQESSGSLLPDQKVKPDATGDPVVADPGADAGEIYGIVIGKANLNDQTSRVGTADTELVIIKVGDY